MHVYIQRRLAFQAFTQSFIVYFLSNEDNKIDDPFINISN